MELLMYTRGTGIHACVSKVILGLLVISTCSRTHALFLVKLAFYIATKTIT